MARIVIGTRHTGDHEVLYCGESGVEAEAALEGASSDDYVLVEYIPHPTAAKRRKFPRRISAESVPPPEDPASDQSPEVPESGTAGKPKKSKR